MRKGVGIATSVVLTGSLYAQQAEEGIVNLWALVLSAVLGYWLGHGLVAGFQSMRSSSPQSPLAREPEAKTKASPASSRRPATPKRRSHQDPRTAQSSGSSPKRSPGTKAGAVQHEPVAVSAQQRSEDGPESDDRWIEKLERLSALRRDGFLTEEEFNSQKRMLLPNPTQVETGRTDQPAAKTEAAPTEKRVSRAELSKYQKLWCAVDGCYSRKTPHGDYCQTHRANRPMQAATKSATQAVPDERTDEQASPPVEQFRQRWCIVDGCYQRKAVGDYCQAHKFG